MAGHVHESESCTGFMRSPCFFLLNFILIHKYVLYNLIKFYSYPSAVVRWTRGWEWYSDTVVLRIENSGVCLFENTPSIFQHYHQPFHM